MEILSSQVRLTAGAGRVTSNLGGPGLGRHLIEASWQHLAFTSSDSSIQQKSIGYGEAS